MDTTLSRIATVFWYCAQYRESGIAILLPLLYHVPHPVECLVIKVSIVTRFAPSPTGSLHLGGARTALFNWLFARHHGGKFLLRIEDTDTDRSSKEVAQSIIEDLSWLGLNHDEDIVMQSERKARHTEIAKHLAAIGEAYYCYCSESEVAAQRLECENQGKFYKHKCECRKKDVTPTDGNETPVIRFKVPENTELEFVDGVHGKISVSSNQIEDMVILRSDGSPTYLLAVVVDDHDMGITHVIRGSDHITNTVKQILIFNSMKWKTPDFFHIPLIHDENGAKLSKRNKAPGIHEYRELGFLPEAVLNYMLRMGWSHKDREIISSKEAIELFSMKNVGVSSSCLDSKKLQFLNHHYMTHMCPEDLLSMLLPFIEKELGHPISSEKEKKILSCIGKFTERAKTLVELAQGVLFIAQETPITLDNEAQSTIQAYSSLLPEAVMFLSSIEEDLWNKGILSSQIKEFAKSNCSAMSDAYNLLRATIIGRLSSPNISEIMEILGKKECINRLKPHIK